MADADDGDGIDDGDNDDFAFHEEAVLIWSCTCTLATQNNAKDACGEMPRWGFHSVKHVPLSVSIFYSYQSLAGVQYSSSSAFATIA